MGVTAKEFVEKALSSEGYRKRTTHLLTWKISKLTQETGITRYSNSLQSAGQEINGASISWMVSP